MDWKINNAKKGLKGGLAPPPDKSISHRAVMFGSIASGTCRVENFLFSEDCRRTLEAFRAMGVRIKEEKNALTIEGKGLKGLVAPEGELYMGNSGTSMRIISGILAGQSFPATLTGDESLSKRPMRRIVDPLKQMGANIDTLNKDFPPVKISPAKGPLKAIDYKTPVASAQVKSCVLAAGLYAKGGTSVTEPFHSRDHTERMLKYFSADIKQDGLKTTISGMKELAARDVTIPGDISSAAFFIVGALLCEGSKVILKNVGLNFTRDGLLRTLKRMGGKIEVEELHGGVEPVGDIEIVTSELTGTTVEADQIPSMIDEVPVLIIAAARAKGRTEIKGISELKVKESDRVKTMAANLSKLGVGISEKGDTLVIDGGCKRFKAAELDSFGDHRIAMSMAVAALVSDGTCTIKNTDCVNTSYPGFLRDLEQLSR